MITTARPVKSGPAPGGFLPRFIHAASLLAGLAGSAAAAPVVSDNFESGPGQWTASGGWGLTSTAAASPVNSMTDSPGAFYANGTDAALTLAAAVNLSAQPRPVLAFAHRYSL